MVANKCVLLVISITSRRPFTIQVTIRTTQGPFSYFTFIFISNQTLNYTAKQSAFASNTSSVVKYRNNNIHKHIYSQIVFESIVSQFLSTINLKSV